MSISSSILRRRRKSVERRKKCAFANCAREFQVPAQESLSSSLTWLVEPKNVLLIQLQLYAATLRPATRYVIGLLILHLPTNLISGKVSQLGKECQFHIETAW